MNELLRNIIDLKSKNVFVKKCVRGVLGVVELDVDSVLPFPESGAGELGVDDASAAFAGPAAVRRCTD